jgi:hypothetical protein
VQYEPVLSSSESKNASVASQPVRLLERCSLSKASPRASGQTSAMPVVTPSGSRTPDGQRCAEYGMVSVAPSIAGAVRALHPSCACDGPISKASRPSCV